MDLVLLLARLVLAAVLLMAGLGKLADRAGSAQSLRDFGVPGFLTGPLGTALPLVELVVAVSLLPAFSAWWAIVAALALILLFSAGVAANLARGQAPDCHCFGQLHATPIGWPTLGRNLVLVAIAAFVLWQGQGSAGPSAVNWLTELPSERLMVAVLLLLAILVAVEGWTLTLVLRQQGRLLLRLRSVEGQLATGTGPHGQGAGRGLPIGTPAPAFTLTDLAGQPRSLDGLRVAGKPLLLVFWDPVCGPCEGLLPDIQRWQRAHSSAFALALVSRRTPEANRAKLARHGIAEALVQQDHEVDDAYQVEGTPSALLVEADGTIGSAVALGQEAIHALVARTVDRADAHAASVDGSVNGHVATPTAPSVTAL